LGNRWATSGFGRNGKKRLKKAWHRKTYDCLAKTRESCWYDFLSRVLRGRELQQLDEELMSVEMTAKNNNYWLRQKKK